jgi:hypothetical protein
VSAVHRHRAEGRGATVSTENDTKELLESIGLGAARYEPLPVRSKPHAGFCSHAQTLVDDVKRVVECQKCGAVLDPITVLAALAQRWDRHAWTREEHTKLLREIESMKNEVRNLKAQKRRASP